ncbi:hypothetical protein FG386_001615 [Cryptosporidium ryanae]|uniref:uncharacterized protein n=1 Tax=Cryptosporidium ryanae TaxID=515981 RepID=UPI00351A83C1|nr:hypothetical protein FG386_001615 [Cryptosporidium ryanae]
MKFEKSDNPSIFIDGVFDLVHAGHFNALRQARQFGEKLIVGINSDEECFSSKGCYPIYNQYERGELIKSCKWVDDVIVGTPYTVKETLLDKIGCNFVAHGDDPVTCSDGSDPYKEPRASGRLKIFHRTEGVSTTFVVTRVFLALGIGIEKMLAYKELGDKIEASLETVCSTNGTKIDKILDFGFSPCQSLITASRVLSFSDGITGIENLNCKSDTVVYIDGSFDIFHIGHLRLFESAKKKFGGRLIIGLYDDNTSKRIYGNTFPILKMMDRALTLLSIRNVDDLIFSAPLKISNVLIETYGITHVISCKSIENFLSFDHIDLKTDTEYFEKLEDFCYEIPRKMGIFHVISDSNSELYSNKEILSRIALNKEKILENINKKWSKEISFYGD